MIVKGIVSAIYNDDKTLSVILPEYNVVTRPIKVYQEDIIDTLKVDDFVLVVVFNDDFNDCMVLGNSASAKYPNGDKVSY